MAGIVCLKSRPSFGSWACYGLGTENQGLPGFMVPTSGGKNPDAGKTVRGSGFLPSIYQGVQCQGHGEPIRIPYRRGSWATEILRYCFREVIGIPIETRS